MKILAYIVLVLIACGSAGYLLRWQNVEQLLILIKPTDSFEQLGTPAAPDYRERKNWAVYPAKGDEDLYRADVLFFIQRRTSAKIPGINRWSRLTKTKRCAA